MRRESDRAIDLGRADGGRIVFKTWKGEADKPDPPPFAPLPPEQRIGFAIIGLGRSAQAAKPGRWPWSRAARRRQPSSRRSTAFRQWRLKAGSAGGGVLPDIGLYCLNGAPSRARSRSRSLRTSGTRKLTAATPAWRRPSPSCCAFHLAPSPIALPATARTNRRT